MGIFEKEKVIIKEVESPELRKQCEEQKNKMEKMDESNKQMENKLSKYENDINNLEKKNIKQGKDIQKLNKDIVKRQNEINNLKNKIEENEEERKKDNLKFQEKLEEKNQEIEQKDNIISDKNKENNFLNSEIRKERFQKNEYLRENRVLKEEEYMILKEKKNLQNELDKNNEIYYQKKLDNELKAYQLEVIKKENAELEEKNKKLEELLKADEREKKINIELSKKAYIEFKNIEEKIKTEYLNENYQFIPEDVKRKVELVDKNDILLDSNAIEAFLNKILSNEMINNLFIEQCHNILDSINLEDKELRHFNILVFGNEGVGKSTLINVLIGEEKAKTGIGRGVTQEFEIYESKIIKGYRFWDSKGLSPNYNLKIALPNLKAKINEINENKELDKQIDCLWYCISGDRFNNYEYEDFLLPIIEEFNKKIPLIIVYSYAKDINKSKEMIESINKTLNESIEKKNKELMELNKMINNNIKKIELLQNNISVIDILAKPYEFNKDYTVNQRNINQLLEITNNNIKEGIESSLFSSLKYKYISKCKRELKKNYKEIKNYINQRIQEISGKDNIILYIKEYQKIFEEIIIKFINNIKGNKDFDYKEYNNDIIIIENKIIEKLSLKIKSYIFEKANIISESLSKKLLEEQNKTDIKYENNMRQKLNFGEFKNKYYEEILKNTESLVNKYYLMYSIPDIYNNIIKKINEKLIKISEEIYNNNFDIIVLMNEKVKNYIDNFVSELRQSIKNSPFK